MLKTNNNNLNTKKIGQLDGLHITIIGAGPGSLTFARGAQANGAIVQVLEQAGDPRGKDAGYTDRSFNLTLNNVGRKVLGDTRAWQGSTDVFGRAIHNFKNGGDVKYSSSGKGEESILTSVPRPVLRKNLVKLAEEKGVEFRFHNKVIGIDPDAGSVLIQNNDETTEIISSDLVILADGLHSLADKIVEALPGGSLNMRTEQLNYITVLLDKKSCKGLSLHHIHFWRKPESNAIAIGLPNKDGSIAALLISRFDDVPDNTSPFATRKVAVARLKEDFQQLLAIEPTLISQVLGRKRGHFYYKSISDYILGKRCVVVGDAGSASPPWAGFGANTAIYSADALVRFMVGLNGDIDKALLCYQNHKLILAELVLDYAKEHGEFLNNKVVQNPDERPIGPILGQLVNIAIKKSKIPDGVQLLSI